MTDKDKKSASNIISIAKCSMCGKMFKISLTPDEVKAFEKSEDAKLICFECGEKIFGFRENK
ncbi:hypothetical protein [Thermoanaerobacterium sp. R66]|uniref:hypothetical protein n=1 Tax=Thermoanaerobacterium sp. R66 TaxID=2742479 RepID=UPI0023800971|nr:hypothetical protein [Thermoanaerobacterium sp. R66]MDE4542299.1 hypothetical protein [Thermoanaerobacterium sp. R66]